MSDPNARAYARKTRGIAAVVVGIFPLLAGIASFKGDDGLGYLSPVVPLCLVVGLALIGLGLALIDSARRLRG